jgi:cyclopropane-fatty-acyl-phospholipid synthase
MYSAISLPNTTLSLYESLVLKWLSRMDKGSLYLTLPSGDTLLLGSGKPPFSAQLHIRDRAFFKRCILYGDIGFGEAYVDGLWETDDITRVIRWFLLNINNAPGLSGGRTGALVLNLLKGVNRLYHTTRANTLRGSRRNISEHYDLSNDFFSLFLDPTMTYSSAYFSNPDMSLEDAQIAKYDRLARQLHLCAGDRVLEIGSGWGANAIHMASRYGCRVTSLTLSAEQCAYATARVAEAGLSDRVEIRLQDYRDVRGSFDKIVSVEMLEAVGHAYLPEYFQKVQELLHPEGIVALQVITCPDSRYDAMRSGVDWIQKHIFPGSLLPSVGAINKAINRTGDLTLVDCKDLGLDYARTLKAWSQHFNAALDRVLALGFDQHFIRKWNYYLSYCEAAFAMRNINVMQLVYTRPNNTTR